MESVQHSLAMPEANGYDSNLWPSYAQYSPTGPQFSMSPSVNQQEYSKLLEAFTHGGFDPPEDQYAPVPYNLASQHSSASSVVFGDAHYSMPSGLNIHPYHQLSPSLHSSHRPDAQTVANLEQVASQVQMRAPPPRLRSAGSAQTTVESGLPQVGGLVLTSPRHSVSTSSASSNQNSPITPFSPYGPDMAETSYNLQHHNAPGMAYYNSPANQVVPPGAHSFYSSTNHRTATASAPLQLSSRSVQGHDYNHNTYATSREQAYPTPSVTASLSHSRGNSSSAGLMDQLVSSRKALASPDHVVPQASAPKRQGTPRSRRSSRIDGTALTPDGTMANHDDRTPSHAGPHRTLAKRPQATQFSQDVPIPVSTPLRPNVLRRSTSDFSGGMRESVLSASTDASAKSASPVQQMFQPRLPSPASARLMRVQSTPHYAQPTVVQPSGSDLSINGGVATLSARRSRAHSNLHMSAIGPPNPTQMTTVSPISVGPTYIDALAALEHISYFLAAQSTSLQQQQLNHFPDLSIGTVEQRQFIDDLKRRVTAGALRQEIP